MIEDWAQFKAYCEADRYSRGHKSYLTNFFLDPRVRFLVLMRFCEYISNRKWPAVIRLPFIFWYRRLSIRMGYSIPLNVFGAGVALPHYGNIIIDPRVRIGRNCRMHVGVNLGGSMVDLPDENRKYHASPQLGDNVYVGPGAKLYGATVIGNDCVIGANAVVTKSFLENGITIAGVPARIISRQGSEERLVRGTDMVAYFGSVAPAVPVDSKAWGD